MSGRKLLSIPDPWFANSAQPAEQSWGTAVKSVTEVEEVRSRCAALYAEQLDFFSAFQRKQKRADAYFQDSVMNKGTLGDRMVAQTIFVRENPFFALPQLRSLLASAQKKGRRESELAAAHLVDLFTSGTVLPLDRLLKSLAARQVGGGVDVERHYKRILVWYFEDQLKQIVADLVAALEMGTRDEMDYHKDTFLKLAHRMIMKVPEREKENLSIIINKAGDKTKRIASRVTFLLGLLLQEHSAMTRSVVAEVERFLYRPICTDQARYYLTLFLTQVGLRSGGDDADLAKSLIQIYFSQLQRLQERKMTDEDEDERKRKKRLKKQAKKKRLHIATQTDSTKLQHSRAKSSKLNSKFLTALLTGISRAFPYLPKGEEGLFDKYMDVFFKVVYTASFNKACQALSLLLKIMVAQKSVSDRFYSSLYFMLVHPELHTSSKLALFFNVLFGALRRDHSVPRVRAFIKRLLQQAVHEQAHFACSALVVVSELIRVHTKVRDMLEVPEEFVEKKPKEETQTKRLKANVDADDDADAGENGENDDGEVEEPKVASAAVSDHAEERAHQLAQLEKLMAGGVLESFGETDADMQKKAQVASVVAQGPGSMGMYNPLKENPLRANADNSCAWELLMLVQHSHPSVAIFARQILKLEPIKYDGDPLLDFSLGAFIDRYAYRAPKKLGQRVPAEHEMKFSKKRAPFSMQAPAVDSKQFAAQDPDEVRPEEKFMYNFVSKRAKRERRASELAHVRELELEGAVPGDNDDFDDDEAEMLLGEEGSFLDDDENEEGDIPIDSYDSFDDEDDDDDEDEMERSDDFMWEEDALTNAFGKVDEREKEREREQGFEQKRMEKLEQRGKKKKKKNRK